MSLLTAAALLLLLLLRTALADVPAQRDALECVFNATKGPNWTVHDGWLGSGDSCQWSLVGCNAEGDVISLQLNNNNVAGTLPDCSKSCMGGSGGGIGIDSSSCRVASVRRSFCAFSSRDAEPRRQPDSR
jgi:hypothetical protein